MLPFYSRISRRMAVCTLLAGLMAAALTELALLSDALAQQLTVLYSFCSQQNCTDGSRPAAGLTMGSHGALYGTTNIGGNSNDGTAFELAPPAEAGGPWTQTVLYSFCSLPNCTDGYNPAFRLLIDKHGALFGTAPYGGSNRSGVAFKLTPPAVKGGAWTEAVLYSFCSLSNCADGLDPQSDLVMDQHGVLFGATQFAPVNLNRGGMAFKLTPPAAPGQLWTETVLYTFFSLSNCTDGDQPRAGLLLDHKGALYGTAQFGGIHEGGVVFKLIPPSKTGGLWAETVLYSFCSVTNCTDGAVPQANLIMDPHGAPYGTTLNGGIFDTTAVGGSPGQGTVFKLTPPNRNGNLWTETVLFRFCSQSYCADGAGPDSGLIMDQHGVLYGTTQSGGSDGRSGTVFSALSRLANALAFQCEPSISAYSSRWGFAG